MIGRKKTEMTITPWELLERGIVRRLKTDGGNQGVGKRLRKVENNFVEWFARKLSCTRWERWRANAYQLEDDADQMM
jgi:hypothetical protein